MRHKLLLPATIAVAGFLAFAPENIRLISVARAACDPGTPLDKTTAEQIRERLIKAGYQDPSHLRKGCDNTWHGAVLKDGQPINVAVTPEGRIVQEGD
jgi:hypothetical protein